MSPKTPADDVKLYFFGAPVIQRSGSYISVDRQKAIALLAYLLLTGHKHRRDVLANLLWPDLDQQRARAGLRRVLRTLRSAIGTAPVVADHETVGLRMRGAVWSDVTDFQQRLAHARVYAGQGGLDLTSQLLLEEAVALYRAELLAGFNLRDAPDFENWLSIEREALRRAVTSALEMLVRLHSARGSYGQALDYAQRWLALEPTDERAHQALMEMYVRSGEPAAARRQYEICSRMLAEELGVDPSEETQLLLASAETELAPRAAPPAPGAGGAALPLGVTRTATVLVTGLAAGLRLPEEDGALYGAEGEELVRRQEQGLQCMRAVLSRYGAYLPPALGDKVVAIFGIPVSHEDDAERAVRAAIELQGCTVGDQQVATGIHTGMVYLQALADSPAEEPLILGAAVDLALRLYAAAGAGETLVTPPTQRLTQGAVTYAARDVKLAGARTLSAAYYAEGIQAVTRKMRGVPGMFSPLVGRERELQQLLHTVGEMETGGMGRLIQVYGAPGVGKSRLVAELRDQMAGRGPAAKQIWLEGRCSELARDTGYGPWREILRTFAQFAPGADGEGKAQQLAARLAALWRQGGLPAAQIGEVAPFLGNLLALPPQTGDVALGALAAEEMHYRTVAAIAAFVTALGRSKPTVIVLEDLHWADAHSLVAVQQVAARLGEFPAALICVARPQADTQQVLERAARAGPQPPMTVQLAELSPAESRRLVEQLLQIAPLPAALELPALGRTEGNPFFIEETLQALMDAGVLARHDAAWSVDEARLQRVKWGAAEGVPESVQNVLLSRIDGQPPQLRRALQAAAVIGREVPLAIFRRILPPGSDAAALLPALEQAGFLLADPAHPHTQLIFRHVLQQAVAYQTLGAADRRALHGQVAQAAAAAWPQQEEEHVEQLAYHYSRSDNTPKAVEYLGKAGARAQGLFLNAAAITFYTNALALLPALPENSARHETRARLLAGLGRVQHTIGDYSTAAQNLQQAVEEGMAAGLPPTEQVQWTYWLADALYWSGDYEAMLAACERAFALLPIAPATQEAIMLNQQMAGAHAALGDAERFITISLQTAENIRELPFVEELASPYHHVIDACLARKQVERAWEFTGALHDQAQGAGNLRALAKAEFIAARICSETGRHAEALARGEAALDLAHKTGDTAAIQFCLSRLMSDALVLGKLEEAERYASLEYGFALEAGDYGGEWLMLVASIHLGLGKAASARTLLEQSMALSRKLDSSLYPEAHLWLGRAQQRLGDIEEAMKEFQAVLQRSKPGMPSPPFMPDAKPAFLLALAALNELLPDPQRFASKVDQVCAELWGGEPFFTQAYLARTEVGAEGALLRRGGITFTEWQWVDPLGDCGWSAQDGVLEIRAANGRDLWWTNVSAPRLVRRFEADLCLQAECGPPDDRVPALGGLLVWVDAHNYLRLDYGSGGRHELAFLGCVGGKSVVVGRGRLNAQRVVLRLARTGSHVTALCREDAERWYTLGTIDFAAGAVSAGLYAAGLIDRAVYPGAYPSGTRICFSDLRTCAIRGPTLREGVTLPPPPLASQRCT